MRRTLEGTVKSSRRTPSTTSLPPSPHDEAGARSTKYLVMMGIRVVCFILMVVITPYGWHTWVLGAAAVFLPYIAVVTANVADNVARVEPESPERALPASAPPIERRPADDAPGIIRISESGASAPRPPQPDPARETDADGDRPGATADGDGAPRA